MTLDDFTTTIADAIKSDPEFRSMDMPFHLGIPPADQAGKPMVPCVTLDGLLCIDDKIGTWTGNLNLWGDDMSLSFIQLSQRFLRILDGTSIVQTSGFLSRPEPENAINRSLYPVRFYITA
ncbi:MAG: hypothetical protein A3H25_14050 [Sphingomonadales bacterium RIFCSPLOWO2_12_FULL_63_15]|nr:MAG: hypothetical protein A3H25_14050 [Sphingomonadales bacterium RIFCSPLOWO2_12_FULL_63_15]